MRLNLDGKAVAATVSALIERGAAMGLDVQMPDGIDVTVTNEIVQDMGGPRGEMRAFVAPKRIEIRWHHKDET